MRSKNGGYFTLQELVDMKLSQTRIAAVVQKCQELYMAFGACGCHVSVNKIGVHRITINIIGVHRINIVL